MDRRGFFAAAGVLASGTLAGCTDVLGDDDGTTPERDPANEVTDGINTAIGLANTAALSLDAIDLQFEDPAAIEFDATEPHDRLDRARTALDDAEAADDGSRSDDIAAAREYVGLVASMVEMLAELLDGATELGDAEETFDPESVEQLQSSLDAAREPVERAVSARETGVEHRDAAAADLLATLDAEFETVAEGFTELVAATDGFDTLTAGYNTLLDGVEYADTAQTLFESEEYEGARDTFGDATGAFESARATFEDGRADAHEELSTELDRATARSDSLTRLSASHERMIEGREPLIDGRDEFEDGNFDAAGAAFADAHGIFTDAETRLEADPAPPEEFDTQFEQARCRASNLRISAEEFAAAVDAAESGDLREADSRSRAGQDALDSVANC